MARTIIGVARAGNFGGLSENDFMMRVGFRLRLCGSVGGGGGLSSPSIHPSICAKDDSSGISDAHVGTCFTRRDCEYRFCFSAVYLSILHKNLTIKVKTFKTFSLSRGGRSVKPARVENSENLFELVVEYTTCMNVIFQHFSVFRLEFYKNRKLKFVKKIFFQTRFGCERNRWCEEIVFAYRLCDGFK